MFFKYYFWLFNNNTYCPLPNFIHFIQLKYSYKLLITGPLHQMSICVLKSGGLPELNKNKNILTKRFSVLKVNNSYGGITICCIKQCIKLFQYIVLEVLYLGKTGLYYILTFFQFLKVVYSLLGKANSKRY